MPSTPKSASKKRTSRSKSPARSTRSRSRSRGRSKSPARKPKTESKSPSRKSPSRKTKVVEPVETEVKDVKQTSTRSSRKETLESAEVTVSKTTTTRETTAVLRPSLSTPQRQSARIASMNSQKDYTDSKQMESKQNSTRTKTTSNEQFPIGGPVATFVMTLLFPAVVFLLSYGCNRKSCSFEAILDIKNLFPRSLDAYFDKQSFLIFVGIHTYMAVLSCLPVGRVAYGRPTKGGVQLQYRLNGFFTLVASVTTFATMWYFGCGVRLLYDKFYQLLAISTVHSFLFSLALYFRAAKVPSSQRSDSGNTGYITHDFFMGRELNPRVGSLDLKMMFGRFGAISMLAMNLAFLAVSYEERKNLDLTLLAAVTFQGMYIVYASYYDEMWLSSMETTQQGLGFMFVFTMGTFVPFVFTLIPRYLLEHPQSWSPLALSAFCFFHLAGGIIFWGSNVQKLNFRRNPNDPAFANMETIPTSGGKKLLVSGWWGLVRHPNYLGEIIMAFTWAAMCGCGACIPYFYPVFILFMLVDRSAADGRWCKQKHGAAWDRYCQRVPYQIIPRVY